MYDLSNWTFLFEDVSEAGRKVTESEKTKAKYEAVLSVERSPEGSVIDYCVSVIAYFTTSILKVLSVEPLTSANSTNS